MIQVPEPKFTIGDKVKIPVSNNVYIVEGADLEVQYRKRGTSVGKWSYWLELSGLVEDNRHAWESDLRIYQKAVTE